MENKNSVKSIHIDFQKFAWNGFIDQSEKLWFTRTSRTDQNKKSGHCPTTVRQLVALQNLASLENQSDQETKLAQKFWPKDSALDLTRIFGLFFGS